MTTSARTSRARRVTARRRIQRSSARPNGGRHRDASAPARPASAPPGCVGDVHLVPERREALRDRLHVDRAAERAGHRLVERDVQKFTALPADLHATRRVFRSSAKNGPDRTRPNSTTSSFMTRRERDERRDTSRRRGARAPAPTRAPSRGRLVARRRAVPARPRACVSTRSAMRTSTFSTNAPTIGV